MKKLLLLFALLVIVSGCITTERKPVFDANNGIIISEFSIDPLSAKAGDIVSFFVDIENVGGTTARDIKASLYGVENLWEDRNGNKITSTPTTDYPEMKPPYLPTNRAGDFKTASWHLKPSSILPQGVTTNFPVTARVTFTYDSTSTVILPAYSDTLYTTKKNKGETVDAQPKVENSHAPIQARVTKASLPLIIDNKRAGNEIARYVLEFVDAGSGYPVTDDVIGRMRGRMSVSGPGVSFHDCLGATGGNTIENIDVDLIKLRSDRRVPFGCSIKIDRSKWTATMSGSVIFKIEINYKYYVEKTVEVPVTGTEEAPAPGQCQESWTCQDANHKRHVKTDCSIETQECQPYTACVNHGNNDVRCEPAPLVCAPTETCSSKGWVCGSFTDSSCGTAQNCGTCSSGTCSNGQCVSQPPPPSSACRSGERKVDWRCCMNECQRRDDGSIVNDFECRTGTGFSWDDCNSRYGSPTPPTPSGTCETACGSWASYGNGYYKAMCWVFTENQKTFTTPSGAKTWNYANNAGADDDCKTRWGQDCGSGSGNPCRCFCAVP